MVTLASQVRREQAHILMMRISFATMQHCQLVVSNASMFWYPYSIYLTFLSYHAMSLLFSNYYALQHPHPIYPFRLQTAVD